MTKRALVIGGGIAGIQTALDIAEAGFEVDIVEKQPTIGGKMTQIDKTFPTLCTQYASEDVDAMVELIAEMQSSTADAVRLGKEQVPIEIIKERFRQLTQMHVAYVLDSLRTTTTQINNIKAYLLTALYNAPTTMGFFYSAQVRHDLRRK